MSDIFKSIVGIFAKKGIGYRYAGTGFLLENGLIVTCAHVIDNSAMSGDRIITFQFEGNEKIHTAEIINISDKDHWDIALLRPTSEAIGVPGLPLIISSESRGHKFSVFGYPQKGDFAGLYGIGEILGLTKDAKGRDALQIESSQITHGFSGCPVWDEYLGGVVGMVSRGFDFGLDKKLGSLAFAIPAETLGAFDPNLLVSDNLGTLYNVPNLPRHYIVREENLNKTKAALLCTDHKSVAIYGALRSIGLLGMGGIGKSVLAAAIARDKEIRGKYADGIVWLTLGQNPNLTARLSQLAEVFGEKGRIFQDVQQGQSVLASLIENKSCLIILDDVWDITHALAFNCIGSKSQLLITTRDWGIVKELGAIEQSLDSLDDAQALTLLAKWSEQSVEYLPSEAHEVAKLCGNLPLAIAMIGAIVHTKPEGWEYALYRLKHADFHAITRQFPDYSYPNLLIAIQVSIDALPSDLQEKYYELAVFPEDTPIPEKVFFTLWDTNIFSKYDILDALETFVERSLVRRDAQKNLGIHDLLRDYIKKQVLDPASLHNKLIQSYKNKLLGDWTTGPNDGYYYQYLAYHLIRANRKNELIEILAETPNWMNRKLNLLGSDASYLYDVDSVIATYNECADSTDILNLVKMHSVRRGIHQKVNSVSDLDLQTLIFIGHNDEAQRFARLRSTNYGKFKGLTSIYLSTKELGDPDLNSLLNAKLYALQIPSDDERFVALKSLQNFFIEAKLPIEAAQIQKELDAILEITDSSEDGGMGEKKPKPFDVFGFEQEIFDKIFELTEMGNFLAAKSLAERIGATVVKVSALCRIASQVPRDMPLFSEIINQAYSLTIDLQDSYQLYNSQVALLPLLLETKDPRYRVVLDNATLWLENLDKNPELEAIASELFKCLISGKYFDEAIDKVRVIPIAEIQSGFISELASKMIENDQIDDGIELIDISTDVQGWIEVFYKVCLALVEKELPDKVVELAFQVHDDEWTQAWEWSSSLYYLSYALAERHFIRQAKDLVHFIPDRETAQVAMGEVLMLADTFTGDEYIKDALKGEGFIDDDGHPEDELGIEKANSLDISDLIKKGMLRQALRYANEVSSTAGSDAVYFQIIKSLVIQGDLYEALKIHQAIKTPQWKEQSLVELCVGFSRQKQVDQAIKIANSVKDPVLHYKLLDQIAYISEEISPTESEKLFIRITDEIGNIESPVLRASAYRNHANYLARANRRYSEDAYQLLNAANQLTITIYSRPKDFALSKIIIVLASVIKLEKLQLLISKITSEKWKAVTARELEMPRENADSNLVTSEILDDFLADFAGSNEYLDKMEVVDEISDFENYLSISDIHRTVEKIGDITKMISTIDDYSIQSQMERAWSTYLAKNGKWVEALENLGSRELDEYIEIIADWYPYFEQYRDDLPYKAIIQCIEVATWFRPDWNEIYQILNS